MVRWNNTTRTTRPCVYLRDAGVRPLKRIFWAQPGSVHRQCAGMNEDELISTVSLGDDVQARVYCPNKKAFRRAKGVLTKEPETIAWLDRIDPGSVVWDIGANIGVYTLYAAIKRQCQVFAFEPAAANYLNLNRNIEINDLQDRITAFCIAVARKSGIDVLYMQGNDFGSSLSNYGAAIDFQGNPFGPKFRQGAVGYSLDDLALSLPFPSYLKIDVDGLERDIVLGGPSLFCDQRVRSVIIELDNARPQLVQEVADTMKEHGFRYVNEDADAGHRAVINAWFTR